MLKYKFQIVVKLLFFMVTTILYAQSIPPVTNYYVEDYKGGNQNWAIDSDSSHVYVANNEGLLEFDGFNWYLHKLPNKTIIRSVKVVKDKIYTGSYEDFGYWERLPNGNLKYTSLFVDQDPLDIDSQSIWEIYPYQDAIIFKSFLSLYIYQKGVLKIIRPGYILMASNVINGRFYVQGVTKGLMKLENNELVTLPNTETLADMRVQAILPYNNSILVGTSLHGCFEYENDKLIAWKNPFNDLLKENQLNNLIYYSKNLYAGTIKNGVYRYHVSNGDLININAKDGLQNNSILGSYISDNILWLALDNGISAIPVNYYAYYLNAYNEDIGAVYDIAELGNSIYTATNSGIYKIANNSISFIEGSQGHSWSLTRVGDEIICGHNTGTFSLKNDKLNFLTSINGGYVFKSITDKPDTYIQGNYAGLAVYSKKDNAWDVKTVSGLNFPVKNIVFEKPQIAWVLHAYKGVFRIHFKKDFTEVVKIEGQYNSRFENLYDIKLFDVDRNIAFYSNEQWYAYNSIEDKIEPFRALNNLLGRDKNAVLLNRFSKPPLVFKQLNNMIFIRNALQDSISQFEVPTKLYANKLVRGEGDQKAVILQDSMVYLALYNDVLVINTKKTNIAALAKPRIGRIYLNNKLLVLNSKIEIGTRDTLDFDVFIPGHFDSSIEYSLGNKHWMKTSGKITLANLPFGTTNMFLRLGSSNVESKVNKLPIYVRPPWYFGKWGILLALFITALIFYLITVFNKYILIKHKKYLEEQYTHAQEMLLKEEELKNEVKLNELLKRQHEIELSAKTKELANTAMEMTKKDELLEHIKAELQIFKNEIIDKRKFGKLLDTVNKNINTSNDWEVFESNFNEIHESFFKELVSKHSHLTSKDLKLCAYLKMNLSTKEIAPIMGISHRGVEIHRYRLRKKLGLNSDQNLNEYLMNLN